MFIQQDLNSEVRDPPDEDFMTPEMKEQRERRVDQEVIIKTKLYEELPYSKKTLLSSRQTKVIGEQYAHHSLIKTMAVTDANPTGKDPKNMNEDEMRHFRDTIK